MKFPRWEPGRQGTRYRKLLLAHGKRWDLYLLDYPPGSHVPPHRDVVTKGFHWRANLRLTGVDTFHPIDPKPGELYELLGGRLVIFRPDVLSHFVCSQRARRMVLSFGVVL